MWGTKSISSVASLGPAAPLEQIKFNPAMTSQLKTTLRNILLSVTSLYPFQKEISYGNDCLTITATLLEMRGKTVQDVSVFPLLPSGTPHGSNKLPVRAA